MTPTKGTLKVCSRGHEFYKSSDCPICPKCWAGYYRKRAQSDFPEKLGAPALRALANAQIYSLKELSNYSEKEIADLHGMGPKGVKLLAGALKEKGLTFKQSFLQ